MVEPVTFEQVHQAWLDREIPDYVIEAFNQQLMENYAKNRAQTIYIDQDNVVTRILGVAHNTYGISITREQVFNQHMLDIENVYRKYGWKVQHFKRSLEGKSSYFEFQRLNAMNT